MLCSDIIAPPLSSILMTKNVWIPCILGLMIQISGTVLVLALPETLHFSQSKKNDLETSTDGETKRSLYQRFKTNMKLIFRNGKVTALVISLSVLTIGNESIDFLLQYVSKRYDWPIAKVRHV